MDSLFTILALVAAGIVAFFSKKAKAERERRDQPDYSSSGDAGTPGQAQPARPTRPAASWEAELRRLLEGEDAGSPPPPAAPPPPLPTVVVARQVFAPVQSTPAIRPSLARPPMVTAPTPTPAPQARPGTRLAHDLTPKFSHVEVNQQQLARLTESQQAYARASQIDQTMSQHIDQVQGHRVASTSVTHRPISPEVTQVMSLFQNPGSVRQAVLASIILGTPKALDESTSAAWSL